MLTSGDWVANPCVLAHFHAPHTNSELHKKCVFGDYYLGKCSHNQEIKFGTLDEHDLPKCLSYWIKFNSFITTTYYTKDINYNFIIAGYILYDSVGCLNKGIEFKFVT